MWLMSILAQIDTDIDRNYLGRDRCKYRQKLTWQRQIQIQIETILVEIDANIDRNYLGRDRYRYRQKPSQQRQIQIQIETILREIDTDKDRERKRKVENKKRDSEK